METACQTVSLAWIIWNLIEAQRMRPPIVTNIIRKDPLVDYQRIILAQSLFAIKNARTVICHCASHPDYVAYPISNPYIHL